MKDALAARWPRECVLDVLRPPPGYRTDRALVSTFSAQPEALVAALTALSGADPGDREIPKVTEFADAVEALRDSVRFACQQGRIVVPRKARKLWALLDHFIEEQCHDMRQRSWHPKVAIARFVPIPAASARPFPTGADLLRVWVSSKNLTSDLSWDVGLLLESTAHGGKGQTVEGVQEVTAWLARACRQYDSWKSIIATLPRRKWITPTGVIVERLAYQDPSVGKRLKELLPTERDTRELVIVSPFIDQTFFRVIDSGLLARTNVFSTVSALSKLRGDLMTQIAGRVHVIGDQLAQREPILRDEERDEVTETEPGHGGAPACGGDGHPETLTMETMHDPPSEALIEDPIGLHAKIVAWKGSHRRYIYLVGSANATRRGWGAGSQDEMNAELIAKLSVSANVHEGFLAFLGDEARLFEAPAGAVDDIGLADEVRDALESARNEVVAKWASRARTDAQRSVTQNWATCPGQVLFESTRDVHPSDKRIELLVGPLAGNLHHWPRGDRRHVTPAPDFGFRSHLIRVALSWNVVGDDSGQRLEWIMRADCIDAGDMISRDRQAFALTLGPKAFAAWLKSALDWRMAPEIDWEESGITATSRTASSDSRIVESDWPTLEEILRSWSRDDESFRTLAARVEDIAEGMRKRQSADSQSGVEWDRLLTFWSGTTQALLAAESARKRRG